MSIMHAETVKLLNSSSVKDGGRINVCNKYTYDRKVHFKDCIINIKVNKIHINPRIYDELEEQLVNHQIIEPANKKDKYGNPISQSKRFKIVTRAIYYFFKRTWIYKNIMKILFLFIIH